MEPTADDRPNAARFRVGWGDLDANAHLSNRAILDRAADARLLLFAEHGYSGARFAAERIGPVILREELTYRRELRLLDEFTVDVESVGLSDDGVRFAVRNTFRTLGGEVTATVTSEGVWLDLDTRKPRVPPHELDAALRSVPRAESFQVLPARRP